METTESVDFDKITSFIIDNLEGGYYHPQMLIDGRIKDKRYSASGETLFGIDRKCGGSINTTESGIKFWQIIDNANASLTWKWNYKGGALSLQLKELLPKMMLPLYSLLSERYLNKEARNIVNNSEKLTFHFLYACWNGAGFFKKFAVIINNSVINGITDIEKLTEIALNSRVNYPNSLIRQGGKKIEKIIELL